MQALSKDELRRLLATARASRTRDWLMILVAFWHGLRASEVTQLTRDAVRDGLLDVRRLKGSNRTLQPLFAHAEPLLNERDGLLEFTREMHGNQRLFPVGRKHFWRLMQHYCELAGIPRAKAHPHVLKHTIALQTIHSAGIENVRQHLGHKSMSSTGAYLKVNDADAAASIERALGD